MFRFSLECVAILNWGLRLNPWKSPNKNHAEIMIKSWIAIPWRIHGAGIYANMTGLYWWNPCYQLLPYIAAPWIRHGNHINHEISPPNITFLTSMTCVSDVSRRRAASVKVSGSRQLQQPLGRWDDDGTVPSCAQELIHWRYLPYIRPMFEA